MDKRYWYKGVGTITLENGTDIRTGDPLDGAPEELVEALIASGKATDKAPQAAAPAVSDGADVAVALVADLNAQLAERDERIKHLEEQFLVLNKEHGEYITTLEAELAAVRTELETANKTVSELTEQLTAPPSTPAAPQQQGRRR